MDYSVPLPRKTICLKWMDFSEPVVGKMLTWKRNLLVSKDSNPWHAPCRKIHSHLPSHEGAGETFTNIFPISMFNVLKKILFLPFSPLLFFNCRSTYFICILSLYFCLLSKPVCKICQFLWPTVPAWIYLFLSCLHVFVVFYGQSTIMYMSLPFSMSSPCFCI